ncbi:contractile injection system protein, VgrG/Pvc8 family, partial [Geofilum rubicundum]|uniref:contractile injection system protein, VgrG/Pvc8 family n=1 Tax=Geofilum rubicundum TaxID=472113 RepID=UPI001D0E3C0C
MSEILNMVTTTIFINGEACDFETLTLRQSMSGHHTFNILVNYKPNKPSLWTVTPETVFQQLGHTVDIHMEHRGNGEITEFTGLVTHIEIGGKDGDQGYARIHGGSPTLLLDMGPSMGSYTDYTLHNILSEELENTGVRMGVSNKPKFEAIIPYAVKYKETSFQFLARLAASCGEWFYYDGSRLVLGNPKNQNTTQAAFDIEIQSL